MFDFLKKKPVPRTEPHVLYPLLFGDVPITEWAFKSESPDEPWASFRKAGITASPAAARAALQSIIDTPGLEARAYLQAWQHLRALDVAPPAADAQRVLGVVVEVGLEQGNDVVAAYDDHSARYLNQGGAAIVWDNPDDAEVAAAIDALLAAGAAVVPRIGPWTEARLPPPDEGMARVNFLTPSGLHFGQGQMSTFMNDPMAGPVLHAALTLMQLLMARSEKHRTA